MKLALLACGVLACGPLSAVEVEGNYIILNDEEMLLCKIDGGCHLVTGNALVDEINSQIQRALISCRNRT